MAALLSDHYTEVSLYKSISLLSGPLCIPALSECTLKNMQSGLVGPVTCSNGVTGHDWEASAFFLENESGISRQQMKRRKAAVGGGRGRCESFGRRFDSFCSSMWHFHGPKLLVQAPLSAPELLTSPLQMAVVSPSLHPPLLLVRYVTTLLRNSTVLAWELACRSFPVFA